MSPLILHHYDVSPYSEKVRRMLAAKQLGWLSVQVPAIMPKPDLMPLTGGYRKTPVLQIGCDIYCDTKLIARVLDQIEPATPLVPAGYEATALMTERWVEQVLFMQIVTLFFQPASMGEFAKRAPQLGFSLDQFIQDRMAMFAAGGNVVRPSLETVRAELPGIFGALDAQLRNQPFLYGERPLLMDFSVYHPIWFALGNPALAGEFTAYPRLLAWAQRIAVHGTSTVSAISGAQAIETCRTSLPRPALAGAAVALPQMPLGTPVQVSAADYGVDAVTGELVISSEREIAVRRQDARAGTVVVHFPPDGFSVRPV